MNIYKKTKLKTMVKYVVI